MSNELAKVNNAELVFEPQNLTIETIKKYLCANASEQELMLGLQIAKTYNLNPLKREVYFVKYKADQPMQVLVGYEVYLKRAERSGKYDGLEITSEGSVKDGNLKAIVKVYRKDWTRALVHEAFYSEYVQKKFDGTPNRFWAEKPVTMIKKVTVSQAFRMAFPDEFDGMPYTADEVTDTEKIVDVKIEEPLKMPVAVSEPKTIVGSAIPTLKKALEPDPTIAVIKAEQPVLDTIPEKAISDKAKTVKEMFGGTLVSASEVGCIDLNLQKQLKEMAKTKGFTPKTFKEFLQYNFEIESVEKMPTGAYSTVNKKLSAIKGV